jgi:hypothetical protein
VSKHGVFFVPDGYCYAVATAEVNSDLHYSPLITAKSPCVWYLRIKASKACVACSMSLCG